ncbi:MULTISPECIES: hypothetical protein [unclassified Streptomyces]|uniref:hypothetical protein n=1 Tax=unclassified Streptomyces TaxID=2593676 RepID=UPI00166211C1|nr:MULTISPECIES: hypothetical protein [unclassified Streptomyces]MBD0844120.1 hypothetical protein [Streptomyces sp. TRM68416]
MAGDGRSKAYLCGRLYATLHALRILGTGSSELARTGNLDKASGNPRTELRRHLQSAGEHLDEAARKDTKRADAAAEVFRAIPDLIPPGGLPGGGFANGASADFATGWSDQLSEYKKKFPSLLE